MRFSRYFTGALIAIGVLASAPARSQEWVNATDISRIYVFGDSLSDSGAGIAVLDRVCKSALGDLVCGKKRESVELGDGFHAGRSISNGPVAAEVMARLFGKPMDPAWNIPFMRESRVGQNYALAGSKAQMQIVFSLREQISAWVAHNSGQSQDPLALHVLLIGANDLLAAIKNPSDGASVPGAIAEIQTAINTLAANGARRVLVYKFFDMSELPRYRTHADAATRTRAKQLTMEFNRGIDSLVAPAGVNILRFDLQPLWNFIEQMAFMQKTDIAQCVLPVSELLSDIKASPEAKVRMSAVYAPGCGPSLSRERLFFDDIHPSGYLHLLLGIASYDFVVESLTGRCALHTWGKEDVTALPHDFQRALMGSIYTIQNTWIGKREYFRLASNKYWYFPTSEQDNWAWHFAGNRPPSTCGTAFRSRMSNWDARHWQGKPVYVSDMAPAGRGDQFFIWNTFIGRHEYFEFLDPDKDGKYHYFPADGVGENRWWKRITLN